MKIPISYSWKLATTSLFLFATSRYDIFTFALPEKSPNNNKKNSVPDEIPHFEEFVNNIASKGKDAFDAVDPEFLKKFTPFMTHNRVQGVSKQAHEIFESGAPGKIGYGFMMGFSSGFCLKKGHSFHPWRDICHCTDLILQWILGSKLQQTAKRVESMFDLNKDGKVDEKDLTAAYDKVYDVVSYNMPTGGGFGLGFVAGLRS